MLVFIVCRLKCSFHRTWALCTSSTNSIDSVESATCIDCLSQCAVSLCTFHIACSTSVKQLASSMATKAMGGSSTLVTTSTTTTMAATPQDVSLEHSDKRMKTATGKFLSFQAVIVACSYTVAFQDQHTLPKRNILSHSCYCGLLSLLVYSGLSGPAHPPKEKYSLSQLLLWLALSARIQWPFRTSTPSQREIFSLTAVIVACSLCSYTVAFQDQHTLPK